MQPTTPLELPHKFIDEIAELGAAVHAGKRNYGDAINGICYTLFLPVYLYLFAGQPGVGAGLTCLCFALNVVFCCTSYVHTHMLASVLALVTMGLSIMCMNLFDWPHKGETILQPQFLWSLLIISTNLSLSFTLKVLEILFMLIVSIIVTIFSPHNTLGDSFPGLLGASVSCILLNHYIARRHLPNNSLHGIMGSKLASMLLAGAFAYHLCSELFKMLTFPNYGNQGGYSIILAGFFASFGLAAAGAFQQEADLSHRLEQLVKERTKEIKKQTEELRLVGYALAESETIVAITDRSLAVEWCNPAFSRLLRDGEDASALLSHSLVESLDTTRPFVEAVRSCFNPTKASSTEIEVRSRYYRVEVSPFPRKPKVGARFMFVAKDITEQRAREVAERQMEKESMLKQAMQDSMDALSHELRTPLQAVMGIASLFLDNDKVSLKDAEEAMGIVLSSSRLLLTLINNLLDVRKCDENKLANFELGPVVVAHVVRDVASFCKPMAALSNIDIHVHIRGPDTGQTIVRSNTLRFQQVLINLLSNAIKYTKPHSTVTLEVSVQSVSEIRKAMEGAVAVAGKKGILLSEDRVAVISVIDCGDGIVGGLANDLFSKFAQIARKASIIGGQSVAQPSGTGLGLNLCVKFIERMGGQIWATNCSGAGGSCFSFSLPLMEQGSDGGASLVSSAIMSSHESAVVGHAATGAQVKKTRILLVDDTDVNLKVVSKMLERIGVERVVTVDSGAKALEMYRTEPFDLVLTDICMPVMSGVQLCEEIQRDGSRAKPVVVGLTAETSERMHQECEAAGMAHVLHKPITPQQLQTFLEGVFFTLRSKPAGSESAS